ncbi:MAG: EamA family transporter [Clostridia bacterium]|nr:EamA family transporter [Clostridia bacterium]
MWIAQAALYGVLKGGRDVMKKLALKKSSIIEVLFFYTLLSLVLLLPDTKEAIGIFNGSGIYLPFIFIKSAIIYIAWTCSFKAIEKLPIGFYGLMDMSRVVITSLLSIILFGEAITLGKAIGMILVIDGLVMLNVSKNSFGGENVKLRYIILTLASCFANSCSEIFDKWFMRPETGITPAQLQFWYMLFLTVLYLLHIIIKRIKIDWRMIYKNYWLILLAVMFVIGDRALFNANRVGDVIPLTLLKQGAVIITILGGKFVFKEKNTVFKLLCAVVVICGIVVGIT